MTARRYGWLANPLLHLVLIAVLVACVGIWHSAQESGVSEIGSELRVISSGPSAPPFDPGDGPSAPEPLPVF